MNNYRQRNERRRKIWAAARVVSNTAIGAAFLSGSLAAMAFDGGSSALLDKAFLVCLIFCGIAGTAAYTAWKFDDWN